MYPSDKPERVAPQDPSLKNTPIIDDRSLPPEPAAANSICYWADEEYSEGATVCANHRVYQCVRSVNGMRWWNTGGAC
jgi:hypothetical protein